MKCTKCGAELDDHAKFCGYCGNGIEKKKIELIATLTECDTTNDCE